MTNFVFANNASTELAAAASSGATTLNISSAANFPSSIPSGFVLPLTLNDANTRSIFEIVYVTAISGTSLTVERGQEGTTAQNWNIGDIAYSTVTAGVLAGANQLPYLSLGTSQTLTTSMQAQLIANDATGLTFTLPTGSAAGNGAKYSFFQQNSGDTLTIAAQGSNKIYGPNGWAISSITLTEEGQFVALSCDGSNWHVVGQANPFASNAATAAGTDTQSAVTPAGLMSVFGKSLATDGYQKLPSGLIVQWGQFSYTSGGAPLTFPIAFPNACLSIVFMDGGNTCYSYGYTGLSATGATIYARVPGTGAYTSGSGPWIAVGY